MAKTRQSSGSDYFMGVLAWLVPGAGHFYLGMPKRGVIIFVTICVTFMLGLVLGGIDMVEPRLETPWFCAQVLAGVPAVVVALMQNPNVPPGVGRGMNLGQLYTGVAGLLNLLCVVDALMKSHNMRGRKAN
jgi:hypothetical protein